MKTSYRLSWLIVVSTLLPAHGQNPSAPAPAQTPAQQTAPADIALPKGTILFESHGPPPDESAPESGRKLLSQAQPSGPELTDAERAAITITSYDMDARIVPATSHLTVRARLTLRNDSVQPLTRIALQISSTLQWESASLLASENSTKLEFGQHLLDTDADHTGKANEAVIVLPKPLYEGKTVDLALFYSGAVQQSGGRLLRIGATADQALDADWDGIAPGRTALRGFGNVLWYPVASRQLFLGEGAELFDAIGATEKRESAATVRMRVGVDYSGEPPIAVYFCGRRQDLKAVSDNPESPIAAGTGFASADFAAQPIGFRLLSLMVIDQPEKMLAPLLETVPAPPTPASPGTSSSSLSSSSENPQTGATTQGDPVLAVEADDSPSLSDLALSAEHVAPLLQEWLGEKPLSALTIIDHPGQPFEDGPMLLAPVPSLAGTSSQPALAHSLTHAWVQTGRPWMDEGLAQFFALLWTERESSREAAVLQLNNLLQPLPLAEPNMEPVTDSSATAEGGQPLISATAEVFYRRKAAAVWFMLRELAGDQSLQAALRAWRTRGPGNTSAEEDALAFEALLEKTSGKDLHWFFNDWVLHDHGLPDLSIIDVTPRELPAGQGHDSGWLVSVTVHNDGGAAAEVPIIIRSGTFSTTQPLRVPAFSNATARVLVEASPTEVQVNDGVTPEIRATRHVREVLVQKNKSISMEAAQHRNASLPAFQARWHVPFNSRTSGAITSCMICWMA